MKYGVTVAKAQGSFNTCRSHQISPIIYLYNKFITPLEMMYFVVQLTRCCRIPTCRTYSMVSRFLILSACSLFNFWHGLSKIAHKHAIMPPFCK